MHPLIEHADTTVRLIADLSYMAASGAAHWLLDRVEPLPGLRSRSWVAGPEGIEPPDQN